MKKYSSLFILGILLISLQFFTNCKEDDTLSGADEVYITIFPSNSSIMLGDTVQLRATVENLSGKVINTPVEWKSDNEDIIKIIDSKMFAQEGSQGKMTKIRAILENGKYAVTSITVTNHVVDGVTPMVNTQYTYNKQTDTVWFAVRPINLLLDYEPQISNPSPELIKPNPENPIFVNKEIGKVGYVFSSGNNVGKVTITMSIGAAGSAKEGKTEVIISPNIISSLGEDFNLITTEMATTMDVNAIDTVWVNTKVDPTYPDDLANAEQLYKWSMEGNTAQLMKTGVKVVTDRGHAAYAVLRSASITGLTKVIFECNGTVLSTSVQVQNYKTEYPVDKLELDKYSIQIPINRSVAITPTVTPISSYGFHIPQFTPINPNIVTIEGYINSEMMIKGLQLGETDITVTSNDKSVTLHVEVIDAPVSIIMQTDNQRSIFEGQEIIWNATVNTTGGVSTIKPNWESTDTSIASVTSEGVITGHQVGEVTIYAESGGIKSSPSSSSLTVVEMPESEINYNNDNTDEDNNTVLIDNELGLVVSLMPKDPTPFSIVNIYIKNITEVRDGTYDAASSTIIIEANGVKIPATSGTITLAPYSDEQKLITINLTVSAGNKSFTIKAALPIYVY